MEEKKADEQQRWIKLDEKKCCLLFASMKINVDNASDETVGWLLISKALRQKPVSHLFSNSFWKHFFPSFSIPSNFGFVPTGDDRRARVVLILNKTDTSAVDMYTHSCIITLERGDGLLFEYGKIQERLKGEN